MEDKERNNIDPLEETNSGEEILESEQEPEPASSGGTSPPEGGNQPETEDWKNRFIRLQADFDNFRKRVNRERLEERDRGMEEVLIPLLEVCDNFSRAIQAAEGSNDHAALLQGVKMIDDQLKGVLSRFEVEQIKAAGEPFDPNLHHAVMHAERDDIPENTVTAELQAGYQRKGKVLRPSMVQVSVNID